MSVLLSLFGLLLVWITPDESRPATVPTAVEVARRIDHFISTGWERDKTRPVRATDDAEFLRRASLDLIGRIPTITEVRDFLDDRSPGKRANLIDRLLDHPGYASHFARVWGDRWLPATASQFDGLREEFEEWLQRQLRANASCDRMVRDLLRVPDDPSAIAGPPGDRRSLLVFLQANEFKPTNLAGNTARMLLGLNLDCAQCHDHPFARWTKAQFWDYAAFFADPNAPVGSGRLELSVPGSSRKATPHFVDGTVPRTSGELNAIAGRKLLADWITDKGNRYFARNVVNRTWAYLFGTGLIEPLDDLSGAAVSSHPELLDELAPAFVQSGYDLKFLLRCLTLSQSYQLSSLRNDGDEAESSPRKFARAELRTLTGDQLYDSLLLATGWNGASTEGALVPRKQFLKHFGRVGKVGPADRSILQALLLLNGDLVAEAADLERGRLLASVAGAPFLDDAQKIETLYLATLARRPRPEELPRLLDYVKTGEPRRRLADILWALLNCTEFGVNH